jgi:hypothetical protein
METRGTVTDRIAADQFVRCFFGHHKGATTWIRDITDEIAARTGLRTAYLHRAEEPGHIADHVATNTTQLLRYVNADIDEVRLLRQQTPIRGVHVIRDPRDTIVSGYFSHRDSHPEGPWLDEHRARLRSLDLHHGLLAEIAFVPTGRAMSAVRRWDYNQPDVLELRMERLMEEPVESMRDAFEFLQMDELLDMSTLVQIVEDNRFEAKTGGRPRGQEDQASHYRKGTPGDWRNYLEPAHLDLFEELYGDLLVDLGYEATNDWN